MPDQLGEACAKVTALLVTLSPAYAQRVHPQRPRTWSIQQIVEHLMLSYRASCEAMGAALERKHIAYPAVHPVRQFAQSLLLRTQYPLGGKTPAAWDPVRPATLRSGAELAARLTERAERLDVLLSAVELRLGRVAVQVHPRLGPMATPQWRSFHALHTLHHLRQIQAIAAAGQPVPERK